MKPVAFFDIDGTVFRSSLLVELVAAMIREGAFPASAAQEYRAEYQRWVAREGTYEAYIEAVIETFLRHLRGVHYGTLADIGRAVVAEQQKRVYRYTRDLLTDLADRGYTLVAVSLSPKTILDEFCSQYGFDKVYGHIYEIGPQDCFTGVAIDSHLIRNKAAIANRVFTHHPELSREGSVAVGDTESDIPLLEMVTEPICFNPNAALYAHARARGWPVVVERKDVIYRI
jgi:HAD superfamily hydrolase (TIGR01490 family)